MKDFRDFTDESMPGAWETGLPEYREPEDRNNKEVFGTFGRFGPPVLTRNFNSRLACSEFIEGRFETRDSQGGYFDMPISYLLSITPFAIFDPIQNGPERNDFDEKNTVWVQNTPPFDQTDMLFDQTHTGFVPNAPTFA
jgi:hypothetical protein